MFLPLLILSSIGILRVGCLELPNYIPKCSLSDPNLNSCIVTNANEAFPRLAKGDADLAIPSITPLCKSEVVIEGHEDLMMLYLGGCTDEMKDFRLTNASFDLKSDSYHFYYEGYINHYTVLGEDYKILTGTIIGIPAYGRGSFNMTLVGVTIRVSNELTIYQKNGETYIYVLPKEVHCTVDRAYYYYENIRSPYVDDVNAYIEKNWEQFTQQITPTINSFFGAVTNYPLHMITSKVPLSKIFLP